MVIHTAYLTTASGVVHWHWVLPPPGVWVHHDSHAFEVRCTRCLWAPPDTAEELIAGPWAVDYQCTDMGDGK